MRDEVDLRLVPPPSLLPRTGMAVGGLLLLALLLVAAGLGLTRRRSSFA